MTNSNSTSLGVILIYLVLIVTGLGLTIYGLYLAFCASIILGIIVFFVEPAPFIREIYL